LAAPGAPGREALAAGRVALAAGRAAGLAAAAGLGAAAGFGAGADLDGFCCATANPAIENKMINSKMLFVRLLCPLICTIASLLGKTCSPVKIQNEKYVRNKR
jgi:hypothetical protein